MLHPFVQFVLLSSYRVEPRAFPMMPRLINKSLGTPRSAGTFAVPSYGEIVDIVM
jgi:hypothetical protein